MGSTGPVPFFHVGPPKTGTTWVFECLREHPRICCPPEDKIHYFSMLFHRGVDWYHGHFEACDPSRFLLDPSPSYFSSEMAAARISGYNPDARIIVCLREPVQRAFSHYWHLKKQLVIDFEFEDALDKHDVFIPWIETGFYAHHLRRWFRHFPRDRVLVQRFEDLQASPRGFLREILEFLGLPADFEPSVLDTRVNVARERDQRWKRRFDAKVRPVIRSGLEQVGLRPLARGMKDKVVPLAGKVLPRGARERFEDVPPEVRRELRQLFAADVEELEQMLGWDLSDWKAP